MEILREKFGSLRNTALAFVAFLVVIPSIINAFGDIIASFENLPNGEKERINAELFKEHFKEEPQTSKQIEIKSDQATLAMSVDIYKNGDIFVDYGQYTQWLPFEYEEKTAKVSFNLINSAYAWSIKRKIYNIQQKVKAVTKSVKNRKISNHEIERVRTLSDGSVEKQIININTGRVIHTESIISTGIKPEKNRI